MSEGKYRVIFSGKISEGYEIGEVKENISKIFKIPVAQCERMFTGRPIKIKDNIPYQEAERYQKAFENAGALCQIEATELAIAAVTTETRQKDFDEEAGLVQSIRDLGDMGSLVGLRALESIRILCNIHSESHDQSVNREQPLTTKQESSVNRNNTINREPSRATHQESTEVNLDAIIMKYRERLQGAGRYFFFLHEIPQNKLMGALSKYAKTANQHEKVLMLVDNTALGSAKDGILLTDKKIYAQSIGEPPRSIDLCNIRSATFVDERSNKLFINEMLFFANVIVDKPQMAILAEMLRECSNLFYVRQKFPTSLAQRNNVVEIVTQYHEKMQGNYVFFAPNIPQNKLTNAIAKYANGITQDERILILLDNTAFGGAKEGVLLTDKKIYAHDIVSSPMSFELQNIQSVLYLDDKTNKLFINHIPFYSNNLVDKRLMQVFAEMLRGVSSVFTKIQPIYA